MTKNLIAASACAALLGAAALPAPAQSNVKIYG